MATRSKKVMKLKSSDGGVFLVTRDVVNRSSVLKGLLDDKGYDKREVPLDVKGDVLAKVIEYCRFQAADGARAAAAALSDDDDDDDEAGREQFNKAFLQSLVADQQALFDVTSAADYLCIQDLLDLACQGIADLIKDMSPEQIRWLFQIENDLSPSEEALIRKENEWAFL